MTVFLIRRLLWMPVLLLLVALLTFSILHLTTGDPARLVAGEDADQETVEAVRVALGLDQPAPVQFARYIGRLVTGDMGRSIHTRRPVSEELANRFPITLKLAAASVVVAAVFGVLVGIVSAARPYGLFDYVSMAGAMAGVSMPSFWIGLLLMLLFSVKLRLLPTGGGTSFQHMILPTITLAAGALAMLARLTRSELLDVLGQDYIRTARSKGLTEQVVIFRHALKNGLIPVVTMIGVQFGHLLGGAVVVEQVFSLPGVGRYIIQAILARDFPVVQGGLIWVAGCFVGLNLLVDLSYAWLDPRIRYQ